MIDDLRLNENGYFLLVEEGETITAGDISLIFGEAMLDRLRPATIHSEIRQVVNAKTYSLLVYSFESTPNFFEEGTQPTHFEKRFGYLLIVEIGNFVVVSKKNVSGLKTLRAKTHELDYMLISRLYIDNQSLFEKFFLLNMDISDTAIRNRSMEALNLKNTVPILTSAKYLLNSMRVRNGRDRFSLAFSTSRINRVGVKRTFEELLEWIEAVSQKIAGFTLEDSYLDVFPKPIDFEANISSLVPLSVLFFTNEIVSEIESQKITRVFHKIKDKVTDIPTDTFLDELNNFLRYRELSPVVGGSGSRRFKIDGLEHDSRILSSRDFFLRVNRKSISLDSKKLKRIFVERDGNVTDVVGLINYKHSFIVNFQKPDVLYHGRRLFHDSNLLNLVDTFLDVFIPVQEIENCTSEKGEEASYSAAISAFPTNSLFELIGQTYATNKYLVCDDLGNEWADFIAIDEARITFIHAKHGDKRISASNFHDIVGQAQKNIGQFFAADREWRAKESKWQSTYRLNEVQTSISRLIVGDSLQNLFSLVKKLSLTANLTKEVHLFVDFISKSELASQLTLLKNGGQGGRKQVVQLLWLISSIVSTCMEYNIKIFIKCLP